jgi:putative transposase
MPRAARIVIPDVPHHVTQRGNNRQDVFFADDDRRVYLDTLCDRCHAAGVRVLGYCLMTNHVHLIVVPDDENGMADAIGRTHFVHTQYINRLHGRSGHLWQGRFYSCPLDETHLWRALVYVERNPVRARLVRRAWRWRWSSAAVHAGKASDPAGVLDLSDWQATWTAARWQKQLVTPEDEGWRTRFWRAAHTGRPLAEDRWLAKLEARLGRRLRANPVGRPRAARTKPTRRRTK